MKAARWLSAAVMVAVSAGSVSQARAQERGFALDAFDPSERGSDWFAVESLDLRGDVRPALGLVMDGAYRPLVLYAPDGHVQASIVRNQIFGNLGGNLVLWDRLRVGFNLPIAVFQDGHDGIFGGVRYAAPDTPSLGDLRLGADVRLAGVYGDPITVALGARVFVPTGSRSNFTGDGAIRIQGRAEIAGDIGPFTYGAHLGAEYRNLDDAFGTSPLGSQVIFGAAAGFRAFDHALVIGPEIYGATIISNGDAFFAKASTPVDAIMGAHLQFLKDFKLGGGVGPGLTRGFGSPVVRWMASLEWAPAYGEAPPPPPADRDHDGVLDEDDACPDTAGVKTDDPATNGCPPDKDKDGVLDADDACPTIPGVKTDDPKTNGCPADRDKDGVPDQVDACPDVPGVESDDPKTNGCPPDRDKDGVLDKDDACPDTAGIKTDDPRTNGCPDPDRDKDGIANDTDACPDVAGPANKDPKKNGCPQAYIQAGQIKIRDQVKFATGSAAIVPGKDSADVLDAVQKIIADHPEIKALRVEGHTDNVGAPAMNRTLSQHRAESVMKWLVAHGIDASRLKAQGFGPDRPIDDNSTANGRFNNRRVEFHLVGGDDAIPATPSAD